jgi:hypothetical protein
MAQVPTHQVREIPAERGMSFTTDRRKRTNDPRAPSAKLTELTPEKRGLAQQTIQSSHLKKGSHCANVSKNVLGMDVRFCQVAANLCIGGATGFEMAESIGVCARTRCRWKAEYPEFCQAPKAGAVLAPTTEVTSTADALVTKRAVTSSVTTETGVSAGSTPSDLTRNGQRSPRMNAWVA